jgi:hypothetical protein
MGLLHSLPWAEQRQYDMMKPWVELAFERVDWFYSQGTPEDVPEYKEAIDYYTHVARVEEQWKLRECEHCDSMHAACCPVTPGQISRGPAAILSLRRPNFSAAAACCVFAVQLASSTALNRWQSCRRLCQSRHGWVSVPSATDCLMPRIWPCPLGSALPSLPSSESRCFLFIPSACSAARQADAPTEAVGVGEAQSTPLSTDNAGSAARLPPSSCQRRGVPSASPRHGGDSEGSERKRLTPHDHGE